MTNNRALKAVREQRGLKVEAVADTAAISAKRLVDFEQGDKEPSRKQAERLSEIYGVPLYSLLSAGIPNLPPLPRDFRKPDSSPAELTPRGMKALWASERRSQFSRQLISAVEYEAPDLLKGFSDVGSSKNSGLRFREIFDDWFLPREELFKFSGLPERKFLGGLRLFFEVQGNVLNLNDAPPQDYFGFFLLPDAGVPTIFINRLVQSKKAQLFTLAHELAHWLSGADGISNPFVLRNQIERSCNVFAAEFLAPMDRFAKIAEATSVSDRSSVFKFVAAVSRSTLLSNHATAIRLVEGGFITQAQLSAWEERMTRWPSAEKEQDASVNDAVMGQPHAKRIGEVGTLPVYLAAKALSEGVVDRFDIEAGIDLSETLQSKAFDLATRRIDVARS